MAEVKALHKEWFPLNYPEDFYQKLLKKEDILAIGIFIEVEAANPVFERKMDLGNGEKHQAFRNDGKIEVMLGSIISKVRTGKEEACEIYAEHMSK